MNDRVRDPAIDILRGLPMIGVLYAHGLEMFIRPTGLAFDPVSLAIWQTISSFVIVAFFFVSGLTVLNLDKQPLRKVLVSSLSLVLIADIIQITYAPIRIATGLSAHEPPLLIAKHILAPLVTGAKFSTSIPWFLVALALVRLLAWVYLRSGTKERVAIWVVTVLAFVASTSVEEPYLEAQSWTIGLAFLLLGREAVRRNLLALTAPRLLLMLGFAVLVALTIVLAPLNRGCLFDAVRVCSSHPEWHGQFGVELVLGRTGFLPMFVLSGLVGIGALMATAFVTRQTAIGAFFAWVGRNTVPLIMMNGIMYAAIEPMLSRRLQGHVLPESAVIAIPLLLVAGQLLLLIPCSSALLRVQQFSGRLAEILVEQTVRRLRPLRAARSAEEG